MKDSYSNMDDIFRDKFKDFELYPPEHIWENIKQQVHGSGKSGGSFSTGSIIGITVLLIITSLFTYFILQGNSEKVTTPELNIIEQNSGGPLYSTPRNAEASAINKISDKTPENLSSNEVSPAENKNKKPQRFVLTSAGDTQTGKMSLSVGEQITENENHPLTPRDLSGIEPPSLIFDSVPEDDQIITEEESELLDLAVTDDLENNNMVSSPSIHDDYGKENNWSLGLFFTPEMIIYPSESDFNSRSYSLDVNAIYKFSGYLIQSGLGVGFSSDNGNCRVDYNQYMGSYQDVYDVTFDTIGGQVIPVYHTETIKVYDTVDHVTISPTKRKFTYLNLPILFGYGHEGRRFGWNVKAGPSLSVLIHENIPDVNLNDSQDKISYVENELPGRLKTSWQFVFSGGVSYKLGNSLNFTLEPVFRYYVNSTYEQNQTTLKKPYSLGIRAGFVVEF